LQIVRAKFSPPILADYPQIRHRKEIGAQSFFIRGETETFKQGKIVCFERSKPASGFLAPPPITD
jgi:hypothetical protein